MAVLQAREANPVIDPQKLSGMSGISQSNDVHHLHDLSNIIPSWRIVPHLTKILQNFWLTLTHLFKLTKN